MGRRPVFYLIGGLTLAGLIASAAPGAGLSLKESGVMASQPSAQDQRLEAYLAAEVKYTVVPVPTPERREDVAQFVEQKVDPKAPPDVLRKLGRLAAFYDLRDTVPAFAKVLKRAEQEPDDYARSALAVAAIARVGDGKQIAQAQTYYQTLLTRAKVERFRTIMTETCFALGPTETTAKLKKWLEDELAKLDARLKDAQGRNDEAETDKYELLHGDLRRFIEFDVPRIDEANAVRTKLLAVKPPEAQIPRLVALYAGVTPEATDELGYWSALRLLHLSYEQPGLNSALVAEFMKVATRQNRQDADHQTELDLTRARCLRAAVFFGTKLGPEDDEWLTKMDDPGTDVLALRPKWKY